MPIFHQKDTLYSAANYIDLTASGTTYGLTFSANGDAPYKAPASYSSSGYVTGDNAGLIQGAEFPHNGDFRRLRAWVVGPMILADSGTSGKVTAKLYIDCTDDGGTAVTSETGTLFATYEIDADHIIERGGMVLDTILPNYLSPIIRVDVTVAAFTYDTTADYKPGLDIQISSYDRV